MNTLRSYSSYITLLSYFFFFFNDTATTEIYTLSLHDALPICPKSLINSQKRLSKNSDRRAPRSSILAQLGGVAHPEARDPRHPDRKSTRLNSSHSQISYAVFCLKKKKKARLRNFCTELS